MALQVSDTTEAQSLCIKLYQEAQSTGEENKCHYYLQERQEGQPRELQAGNPLLDPWEVVEQLILETFSRHMMEKRISRSSQHEFNKKKKSHA